jgi:hypothetical protein
MAAGNFTVYSQAELEMGNAAFNFSTDTFVVVLLTSAYTPAPDTHATWADVSAFEVAAGGNYAAGGQVLAGLTWTTSGGIAALKASNVSWPASTITAKYPVIVRRAGASLVSTDKLFGFFDVNSGGGSLSTVDTPFNITWNASGIVTGSHTP